MTHRLAGSLILVLGVTTAATAQQGPWRPAGPVVLDRPVPMTSANRTDSALAPVVFSSGGASAVVRAKGSDDMQRMPSGPADASRPLKMPDENAGKSDNQPELLPRPKSARPDGAGSESGSGWEGACGDSCCDGGSGCNPCPPCPPCCCSPSCCDPCCDSCCCDGLCGAPLFGGWFAVSPNHCTSNCLWFRGEYLLWRVRQGDAPPLVTTGSPASAGVLGRGGSVIFGGPLNYEDQSGGRVTLGFWLSDCERIGIEGSYFALGQRATTFDAASSGDPLLARPIINAANGQETSQLVANPVAPNLPFPLAGRIAVMSDTELTGAEFNGIFNIERGTCGRLDFITGFRYVRLSESLGIAEDLMVPATPPTTAAGGAATIMDQFTTRDEFYGGQLGLRSEWYWRRWQLDVTAKVALGDMHQTANIAGFTQLTMPAAAGGGVSTFPAGILALPTNIGSYSRDRFAVVPELGVTLGYQLTTHMRFFAGYNLLYATNVVRPGQIIDRTVNLSQLPGSGAPGLVGPARPAFVWKDSDFWAQGATFGLEFKY